MLRSSAGLALAILTLIVGCAVVEAGDSSASTSKTTSATAPDYYGDLIEVWSLERIANPKPYDLETVTTETANSTCNTQHVLVIIPHDGRLMPKELASELGPDFAGDKMQALLEDNDTGAKEIYAPCDFSRSNKPRRVEFTTLRNKVVRAILDMNRLPEPKPGERVDVSDLLAQPKLTSDRDGMVKTHSMFNHQIWEDEKGLTAAAKANLLNNIAVPYVNQHNELVRSRQWDLIVLGHTMPPRATSSSTSRLVAGTPHPLMSLLNGGANIGDPTPKADYGALAMSKELVEDLNIQFERKLDSLNVTNVAHQGTAIPSVYSGMGIQFYKNLGAQSRNPLFYIEFNRALWDGKPENQAKQNIKALHDYVCNTIAYLLDRPLSATAPSTAAR